MDDRLEIIKDGLVGAPEYPHYRTSISLVFDMTKCIKILLNKGYMIDDAFKYTINIADDESTGCMFINKCTLEEYVESQEDFKSIKTKN
jgi:hypothetical protein